MARQRDYRAEYQARKARAQAAGFSGYGQRRRAAAAGVADPERYARIKAEAEAARARARRQVHDLAGGRRMVTTTSRGRGYGVVNSQLRQLGGRQVTLTATVRQSDGTTRTVNLFGRGGYSAARVGQLDAGSVVALIAEAYAGEAWADDLTEADVLGISVVEQ